MPKAKKKTSETPIKKQIPQFYGANVFKKCEPLAKDIPIGRFGYWESTNELKLIQSDSRYHAKMEHLLKGNIRVGKSSVSVHQTPKDWITNLCRATSLGYKIYATEASVEDETT